MDVAAGCVWRPWFVIPVLVVLAIAAAAGCGARTSERERLIQQIEQRLEALETVQGNLSIGLGGVALRQDFWLERPRLLRTETEFGPQAFQGTIVVLNEHDGWFYSPALNLVTVTDRSNYTPELADVAGAGSRLERMPAAILDALRRGYPFHVVGDEPIAGRNASHIEIAVSDDGSAFPRGPLHVWLDEEFGYPLALRDSQGLDIRFSTVAFDDAIDPLTFEFSPPPGARVERVASSE